MSKKFYKPVPLPSPEDALRCLATIYDEPTRAAKVALYVPFVGTDYIPRSWIQAALFICAGGHVFANTTVFRTKLRKKAKRPILTSTNQLVQ